MSSTTLPSFVDLMASLGLDQAAHQPEPSSPSPRSSPTSPAFAHRRLPDSVSRVRSQPSLRERNDGSRVPRVTRYSPYSGMSTSRRGSTSSTSAFSPDNKSLVRPLSTSPRLEPLRRRTAGGRLTVNQYESTSDLNADTPISTYIRKRTPGASPTSSDFSSATGDNMSESSSPDWRSSSSPQPLVLPTLPPFFLSSSLDTAPSGSSFPPTPNTDTDQLVTVTDTSALSPGTESLNLDHHHPHHPHRLHGRSHLRSSPSLASMHDVVVDTQRVKPSTSVPLSVRRGRHTASVKISGSIESIRKYGRVNTS
jgi:hypothetical protein